MDWLRGLVIPSDRVDSYAIYQSMQSLHFTLCELIKGNESVVADIYFEILAKKEFRFL